MSPLDRSPAITGCPDQAGLTLFGGCLPDRATSPEAPKPPPQSRGCPNACFIWKGGNPFLFFSDYQMWKWKVYTNQLLFHYDGGNGEGASWVLVGLLGIIVVVVASGTTPAKKGQLQTSGLISHHFWLSCCQWHLSRPPLCSIVLLLLTSSDSQKRPGKSMSSPLTQLLPNWHTNQIRHTGLEILLHGMLPSLTTQHLWPAAAAATQSLSSSRSSFWHHSLHTIITSFVLAVVVLAKQNDYRSTMTILLDNDILRLNEGIYCNLPS